MNFEPETLQRETIGVIGLGLLGRGIAACLLGHGLHVIGFSRSRETRDAAQRHIDEAIHELIERANYPRERLDWRDRYRETDDLASLGSCSFIIESIVEDFTAKQAVYDQLEQVVGRHVPIASNTSALPISLLQRPRRYPDRFVGMHWGEPCHVLRFLEIIRGEETSEQAFEATIELAQRVGKEPSLVRKDVRGFVTNRLMYAMLREAFHLLETGVADIETIDRSFRNDMGWWATIAGPFRWMDLTGIPAYAAVMKELLPELSSATEVPPTLQKMVEENADGISNRRGFYEYSEAEAEAWERKWYEFTWDIRRLAEKYVPVEDAVAVAAAQEEI